MALVKEYKIGVSGLPVSAGGGANFLVTGLTPSSPYDFYLRNKDSVSGAVSAWVGPRHVDMPAATYSPADDFNGWWPVDLMTPDADSTPEGTLTDQAGSADFTASGSARPLYRTNSGDPYLEFNGTTHVMNATSPSITGDFTFFMICAIPSDSSDYMRFFEAGVFDVFGFTSIGRHVYAYVAGNGADYTALPAASPNLIGIFVESNGLTMNLRVNGNPVSGSTAGGGLFGPAMYLASDSGGNARRLNLKDIGYKSGLLTSGQFSSLAAYVLAQYGVTL